MSVVPLAVPFAAQVENLKAIRDARAPGQIVVDAAVPLETALGSRPTRIVGVPQKSVAQQALQDVPLAGNDQTTGDVVEAFGSRTW